jgi:hypothetical protein
MPNEMESAGTSDESKRFDPLLKKLSEVRAALLKNPDIEELKRLQLHADLLESVLCEHTDNAHHHDTSEHHDHHGNPACVTRGLEPRMITPGLEPRKIRRTK